MNETNDVTFIRDSKKISPKTKLLILIAAISVITLVVFGGYLWSFLSINQSSEIVSVGLEGELPLDVNPYGYIYLSGFIQDRGMNTYALKLETNVLQEITTTGNNWEFWPFDQSHALFATSDTDNRDQTEIVIADYSNDTYLQLDTPIGYYKRNIQSYTGENDGVLYTYRVEPATEGVFFDPRSWQIVVGAPSVQTYDTLPEAFAPFYLAERNEIIFAKSDGIYNYNLRTKSTYRIETGLTGLKADSEIAISPDRSKMILTAPIDNSLIVFTLDTGDVITAQNSGVIQIPNRHFLSPVISPDNRLYAVYAFTDALDAPVAQVELRSFESKELVGVFPVDTFDFRSVRLNAWTSELILETAQEHGHDGPHESAAISQ